VSGRKAGTVNFAGSKVTSVTPSYFGPLPNRSGLCGSVSTTPPPRCGSAVAKYRKNGRSSVAAIRSRHFSAIDTGLRFPPGLPVRYVWNRYTSSGATWYLPTWAVRYPAPASSTGRLLTDGNELKWWKWCWCPYWPFRWLCRPDRMTDRLALQLAVVQKALSNRVPSAARASRCGVRASGFP
jgi:hypothetical protein